MRTLALISVLSATALAADDPTGLRELQGRWQGESMMAVSQGGRRLEGERVSYWVTIEGDQMVMTFEQVPAVIRSTIKVDPTRSPKTIDETRYLEGKEPVKVLGIYKVEGDTLTMTMARWADLPRPVEFGRANAPKIRAGEEKPPFTSVLKRVVPPRPNPRRR